jgi:membrane protein implicated in regulation of membrane protease activity
MLTYAHLGHWYVQLAFAAPALVVIGYMARDSVRRRRRERQNARGDKQSRPAKRSQPRGE